MPSEAVITEASQAAMADPVPHVRSITPFTPVVDDARVVADLRSRIAAARQRLFSEADSGSSASLAANSTAGVGPALAGLPRDLPPGQQRFAPGVMADLLAQWERLDLSAFQTRLTGFPHFKADIDWCSLHFIHRRSVRADAIPLLLLHGWPGSVWEFAEVIDALANPASADEQAFHVVAPSLPGYLWSSAPPSAAHYVGDVYGYSRIVNALMVGLGYGTEQAGPWRGYAVQGGDWGSCHARVVACIPGSAVRAVHLNFCPALPPGVAGKLSLFVLHNLPPAWLLASLHALGATDRLKTIKQVMSYRSNGVYYHMQGNRPGQLMWGLLDSPIALLGYVGPLISEWVEDNPERKATTTDDARGEAGAEAEAERNAETGANPKAKRDLQTQRPGGMTAEKLLELVTLYWVTGCVGTSFLPYVVNRPFETYVVDPALHIRQPLGYSAFPHELISSPIGWVKATGRLTWALRAEHGGHFPHIEVPHAFLAHLRQAFSPGGRSVDTSLAGEPLVSLKGLWDEELSNRQ